MAPFGRRKFLQVTVAAGAALVASPLARSRDFELPEDLKPAGKIEGGRKPASKILSVSISGLYQEVPGIVEVDCGRVSVSVVEAAQGDKPEYRNYDYGDSRYEDLTMLVEFGPKNKKLLAWVRNALQPDVLTDGMGRTVTVRLMERRSGDVLRTYRCLGCLPVDSTRLDLPSASNVGIYRIRCRVGRVEIA